MLDSGPRRWVVGSEESCDVQIGDDPFVSGVHCVLERKRERRAGRSRSRVAQRNVCRWQSDRGRGAARRLAICRSGGRRWWRWRARAARRSRGRSSCCAGAIPVLRRTVEQALESRTDRLQRADRRRDRDRQGSARAGDSRELAAEQRGVRRGELRRDSARADRDRAVRSREGRVHGRDRDPRWLLRGGERRDAVPRRDRRAAHRAAASPAARARDADACGASAARSSGRSTCGSSRRRTGPRGSGTESAPAAHRPLSSDRDRGARAAAAARAA